MIHRAAYTEEEQLQVKPGQYLAYAQKAMALLRWHIVHVTSGSVSAYTPLGEIVTAAIEEKKAILHSVPAGDHTYTGEEQDHKNITRLKHAIAHVIEEQEKADRNLHPMHREPYGALIPSKSYLVTPLILYINVLLWLAMVVWGASPLHPTAQSLFLWGGNLRPAVAAGEWWRLITSMFLHGGALHLLGNAFALLYIGMFLEPLLGKLRFSVAYMLTGICAGIASLLLHKMSVGVGASGAIFGMYGVFLALLTTSYIQRTYRKTLLRSLLFFIVYNLMMGLQGNTDNAAHVGGLLSGMAIGYVYYAGLTRKAAAKSQVVVTAMLTGIVALVAGLVLYCL